MPERSDVVFIAGLDAFGQVVVGVGPDDWGRPTPCEGWTALDVLGHVGSTVAFGTSVLEGRQHDWPEVTRPAELVDAEPQAYWRGVAAAAREALVGADLDLEMDTPMGRRTVGDRLAFPAIDLHVHAWDIGRAAGIGVEIPDDVIELAHHHIDPLPAEMVRGPRGSFGPEVAAPPGATTTEAFIAWTGRQPR